jgi:hypothetical protein
MSRAKICSVTGTKFQIFKIIIWLINLFLVFIIYWKFIFGSDSIDILWNVALHLVTEVDCNCIAALNFWS